MSFSITYTHSQTRTLKVLNPQPILAEKKNILTTELRFVSSFVTSFNSDYLVHFHVIYS